MSDLYAAYFVAVVIAFFVFFWYLIAGPRLTKVGSDEILYVTGTDYSNKGIHVGPCRVYYQAGSKLRRSGKYRLRQSFRLDDLDIEGDVEWRGANISFIELACSSVKRDWQASLLEDLTIQIHSASRSNGKRTRTVEDLVTIRDAVSKLVDSHQMYAKIAQLTLRTVISSEMPVLISTKSIGSREDEAQQA